MDVRRLNISDALEFTPQKHHDGRGLFLEWYRHEPLVAAGASALDLRQANISVSSRGVLRGIHYSSGEPGQAKYVTAVAGAVTDFIIDLRRGSPTFGQWDSVTLDDVDRRAVYVGPGLGHALLTTSATATVCYLTSQVYSPEVEHSIHPLDPQVGLRLPPNLQIVMSPRDERAPSLARAVERGILPHPPHGFAAEESS